jgi:hypothetical protein
LTPVILDRGQGALNAKLLFHHATNLIGIQSNASMA